jgi:hypothetical protein
MRVIWIVNAILFAVFVLIKATIYLYDMAYVEGYMDGMQYTKTLDEAEQSRLQRVINPKGSRIIIDVNCEKNYYNQCQRI